MTNILLADDNWGARTAIRHLLWDRPDLHITFEANDGEEAVQIAKSNCPDVAILDIEMPRKNGIQAAKEIIKYCPQTLVLTDSVHDVVCSWANSKKAGVKVFVSKLDLATDLIPAIERILKGRNVVWRRRSLISKRDA